MRSFYSKVSESPNGDAKGQLKILRWLYLVTNKCSFSMNTLDMLFHFFFDYGPAAVGASGFFMHYGLRLNCRVLSGFVLNSLGFVFKHLRALGAFDMKLAVVKSGGVLLTIPKVCEENLRAERATSPN